MASVKPVSVLSDFPVQSVQSFEICPFKDEVLGAEVLGLDTGSVLGLEDFTRIYRAFLRYKVLVFRNQSITPEQQVRFSRLFGELQIHVLRQFLLPGRPEVFVISNILDERHQPVGLGDAGKFWHSDLSYKALPSMGAMLHARTLPEDGGDTLFADQQLAYERLPEPVQRRLDGLQANHSYTATYHQPRHGDHWRPVLTSAQLEEVKEVLHPVVRTHPETGRKGLFVSESFTTRIEGLVDEESRRLLDQLFAHSIRPEFIYRHRWQEHDLLFWDNRALIHLATGCPDHLPRRMHRTTIQGDAPF